MLIKTAHIAAALLSAAKDDIRYYLNGVSVELNCDKPSVVVATDGTMTAAFASYQCEPELHAIKIIIPRDICERAIKLKAKYLVLRRHDDAVWEIGGIVFRPTEGTFPEWRRVAPACDGSSPATATFDPEKLLAFKKIAKALGRKNVSPEMKATNGPKDVHRVWLPGLEHEFVGAVMPFDNKRKCDLKDWHL